MQDTSIFTNWCDILTVTSVYNDNVETMLYFLCNNLKKKSSDYWLLLNEDSDLKLQQTNTQFQNAHTNNPLIMDRSNKNRKSKAISFKLNPSKKKQLIIFQITNNQWN